MKLVRQTVCIAAVLLLLMPHVPQTRARPNTCAVRGPTGGGFRVTSNTHLFYATIYGVRQTKPDLAIKWKARSSAAISKDTVTFVWTEALVMRCEPTATLPLC